MPILEELLSENKGAIFARAAEISSKKRIIFSSSVSITTFCKIQPPCAHCEWFSDLFFRDDTKTDTSQEYFLERAAHRKNGHQRIVIPSGWQGEELPSFLSIPSRIMFKNIL